MDRQRYSSRVPPDLTPALWARRVTEVRARGGPLIDLTEANPTRVGLAPNPHTPDPFHSARDVYDPDPRGLADARRAIARYYADRGATVDPDHIILTSSTSESYAHLFRLLADPGETVLVPQPGYPLFEPIAQAEGIRVRPYRIAYDGDWHLDAASLDGGDRPRAVVLVQPNHPTGTCLSPTELAVVEAWCETHGASIIVDEVFGDYRWREADAEEPTRTGFATLAHAARVPTFVTSGLSKVCGLPQVKAAWVVVAGPESERNRARDRLEWLADLFLSVSAATQAGLTGWLERRTVFQHAMHERIATNREALARVVAEVPAMTWLRGHGGWNAILRFPGDRTEDEWVLGLLEQGVLVHPGYFYDFEFGPLAVVSLIVPPDVFGRGIEGLAHLLRGRDSRAGARIPPARDPHL